jgi:hypothetical protein
LYEVAGAVDLLRKSPFSRIPLSKSKMQFRKQDQTGILAQFLLLCGNLRLEFFPANFYSALQLTVLSSAAMVNAARLVQIGYASAMHAQDLFNRKIIVNPEKVFLHEI